MQSDSGTQQLEEQAKKIKLIGSQKLYEHCEHQQWQSQQIDFSKDKLDRAALSDEQRNYLVWLLLSFSIEMERVTTQFSGLVMAYDDEQDDFLASQQVDEARHMQFFDRFYREVVGLEQRDFDGRLQCIREELNKSHTKLFDESSVEAGPRLIKNPRDRAAKIGFRDDLPPGDRRNAGPGWPARHHRSREERHLPRRCRGVPERGPRRAPSRGLRHVPSLDDGGRRPHTRAAYAGEASGAQHGLGWCARAGWTESRRGVRRPRLQVAGGQRVRLHVTHPRLRAISVPLAGGPARV